MRNIHTPMCRMNFYNMEVPVAIPLMIATKKLGTAIIIGNSAYLTSLV